VLALTDEGRAEHLAAPDMDRLLTALEELEAVMLPFAPHQRPHGTPGSGSMQCWSATAWAARVKWEEPLRATEQTKRPDIAVRP